MSQSLSVSTRFLIAFLLLLALVFQFAFAVSLAAGQVYARNGRVAVNQQLWNETVWYYEHALEWYPHDHHWWFAKGQGHQGLGERENTIVAFNKAYEAAPNHVSSIASLVNEVREDGDPNEVRGLLDRGFALAPHFWSLHFAEALLLIGTGEREKSVEVLHRAQRYATVTLPIVETTVAYEAFVREDLERAEYAVNKAISADRDAPETWQLHGQIRHSRQDADGAVQSYERAIQLYTRRMKEQPATSEADARLRGETQAYLGFAYAALEQDDRAVEQFAASTEQYVDLKFFGESIDLIHARNAIDASETQALWARVLSASGRHEEAMGIFKRLEESNPESLAPQARYYWANSLRQTGDPLAAVEQYRKMSRMTWTDAMAYAETLVESGQPAAAQFEYNRILTLFPVTPQQKQVVEQRMAALGQ